MKAIQTKYLPATNFKPSRIKAWIEGGASVTVCYNSYNDERDAHRAAAEKLHAKLEWERVSGAFNGYWVSGGLPNGNWCHVAKSA